MSIVVKWGRERLHFPVPPPDAKLGQLRHDIAEYTQLPAQSFKLIHAGAVMKDDNAPVSAYGIKGGSTIALVGGGEPVKAPSKPSEKAPRTERLDKVRSTLRPDVDSFLSALTPASAAAHVGPEPTTTALPPKPASAAGSGIRRPADFSQEHVRLGEMLLQSLLRLDAMSVEGDWEAARNERRAAVKEVQALLDRLDGAWRVRARN
ncbi:hypothetical protein C8T65DRAFT_637570 [Cerioporus squamosus]|nr:hypothetical protein C8T65DRAFT_637570 [Cerioporus squamosus]